MFSQASVVLSTWGTHAWQGRGGGACMVGEMATAVRILLECILINTVVLVLNNLFYLFQYYAVKQKN